MEYSAKPRIDGRQFKYVASTDPSNAGVIIQIDGTSILRIDTMNMEACLREYQPLRGRRDLELSQYRGEVSGVLVIFEH